MCVSVCTFCFSLFAELSRGNTPVLNRCAHRHAHTRTHTQSLAMAAPLDGDTHLCTHTHSTLFNKVNTWWLASTPQTRIYQQEDTHTHTAYTEGSFIDVLNYSNHNFMASEIRKYCEGQKTVSCEAKCLKWDQIEYDWWHTAAGLKGQSCSRWRLHIDSQDKHSH